MSVTVADAAVRLKALDPCSSFIVQAPAGSGKTELLTRRILTLLALVDEPEEILAITFTRKAASEMRQRVITTLREAADEHPVANAYQHEGRALAEAVLARDRLRNWRLLENPSRLAMQTIDSLCSVLTRQLPVTSNFGAQLDVLEDARRLYMLAAERCIESNFSTDDPGYDALRQLLGYLDNNVERLQRLLADMLGGRDQWLRHYRQAGSRVKLESDLAGLVAARFEALRILLPMVGLDALPALLQHAADNLAAFDIDNPVRELGDLPEIPAPGYDSGAIWQLLADVLVTKTKSGNFRKSVTRNEGFPVSAVDATDLGTTVAELKAQKAAFSQVLASLRDVPGLESLLKEIRELPLSGYSDEQWLIMGSLLDLLRLSVAELHFVFAEQGVVDFTETALRAANALGDEDAPTDLALALDYKLSHILVDEFQDTSISQDALFTKLVAGWEPGDGRTFFAVGDPMQSIYRFRDAEVSLFLRASRFGVGGIALTPLQLEVNFRSEHAIVNWCNSAFSKVFPTASDMTSGAVTYAHSIPAKTGSTLSGQHFHPFVDADRVTQADWIGELVAAALDDGEQSSDDPENVAILVRSKSVLTEIFSSLQQRGIAYQAIDIETLGDRLVVRDILSLCRALLHPLDRIHWLAVLRAPWCGVVLDDLYALVDGQGAASIWSLINSALANEHFEEPRRINLSEDGRERILRLRDTLQPALQRAYREPLIPWIEALWLKLGGPASCQFAQDLLAAEACFTELAAIEQAGLLSDAGFVNERMSKLFAPALQSGAVRVQIMTIHKSKGLEFDTVILPALERQPRGDEARLLNWFEYFGEDTDAKLLLAPISETNIDSGSAAPIVKMVKSLQSQKSANELLRLLYVAATRAKRHLHLVGNVTHNAKGELSPPHKSSLLAPLWPLLAQQFEQAPYRPADQAAALQGEDTETISESDAIAPLIPALSRISLDWQSPDMSRQWLQALPRVPATATGSEGCAEIIETVVFDWASANARHIGTVAHRQLQRISDEGIAHWSVERVTSLSGFYQSLLKTAGVAADQLDSATGLVIRALSNALSESRGQWLLGESHQQTLSEYKLTGLVNDQVFSGIIDRTFIDENDVRWIVDFKTGMHRGKNKDTFLDREQERYRAQLERYAVIMGSLEERDTRLGLYFPLLSGWREWQYNADNDAVS